MGQISIREATIIALNICNKVDTLQEYADAYYFFEARDDIVYGGDGTYAIVLKAGGKSIWWHEYFMRNEDVIEIGGLKKVEGIIRGDA